MTPRTLLQDGLERRQESTELRSRDCLAFCDGTQPAPVPWSRPLNRSTLSPLALPSLQENQINENHAAVQNHSHSLRLLYHVSRYLLLQRLTNPCWHPRVTHLHDTHPHHLCRRREAVFRHRGSV